jgi:hypothetical protein
LLYNGIVAMTLFSGTVRFSSLTRFALMASCLAGALFLKPVQAQAQEGVFMKELLGSLGVIDDGSKAQIDYRERAPLVLPPSTATLRSPVDVSAKRAPNWPEDPDVVARREARREALIPQTEREKYRLANRPELSASDIRAGRRPGAGLTNEPRQALPDNTRDLQFIDASKMRQQDEEIARQLTTRESQGTARRGLTDPPGTYRKPTTPSTASASPTGTVMGDKDNARGFIQQIFGQ